MYALVSPAKKLDFDTEIPQSGQDAPQLLDDTLTLAALLKSKTQAEIQSMMKLSDKLGALNYERYQRFSPDFTQTNARPAMYAFRGDTYVGLDADSLSEDEAAYAQGHLGLLSGLYGLLRPLDLMQPYRLEMGTKIANDRGEGLYDFWGDKITSTVNEATKGHKNRAVISLASNEYIKAVKPDALEGAFITCHFKEMKGGAPKVIGLFAKRARGSMARYIIQNRVEEPEGLKGFDTDGYQFIADQSDEANYVFIRDQESA